MIYSENSQSRQIEEMYEKYLNLGETDTGDITTKICDALNVKRPTVRRVKSRMLEVYKNRVTVLS